jgi:hypothetical protein
MSSPEWMMSKRTAFIPGKTGYFANTNSEINGRDSVAE